MEVTKTLKPGSHGTARLVREYGDRLVRVRYRFDPSRKKNITTVELIVDEREALGGHQRIKQPTPVPKQQVIVRIGFGDGDAREQAKQVGGRWDPNEKGWVMPFSTVKKLGWEARIIKEKVPRSRNEPREAV